MRQFNTLLAATTILLSFVMSGQIQFSEKAIELGCGNSTYGTGSLGGGASFFDFDQDGWDDLTLSSEDGQPLRFFKNDNGFFTEVNLGINNTFETKTVQWVDFDNDGDFDFFSGNSSGTVTFYENIGTPENFNLKFITNQWQDILIIGGLNSDQLHGASSLEFTLNTAIRTEAVLVAK